MFRAAGEFGEVCAEKADDMQRPQHAAHASGRRVAILTDSGADIPRATWIPRHPHGPGARALRRAELSRQDRTDTGRVLHRARSHPQTSQPPPGDFRRRFEFPASHYQSVLSINVTRRVSGTIMAAETAAARTAAHGEVRVQNSRVTSAGTWPATEGIGF